MPRCSPLQQGKRWHVDTQWIANLHRERGVEGGGEVWGRGGDWREVVWRIQTATIGFFFPTLKIRGGKELQRSITLNTGCVPPTQPTPLHTLLSLSPTTSPSPPPIHTFSSGREISSHKLIILPWADQRRRQFGGVEGGVEGQRTLERGV